MEFFLNEIHEFKPVEVIIKETEGAFTMYEDDSFPTYKDFRRLLVRLLKNCFERYLIGKNLLKHELSSSFCYFFEHNDDGKIKGSFLVNEKKRNIGLTGKYYDSFWHYAISIKPMLYPDISFSIKSHIVFTNDKKTPWNDVKKMHSSRRDKGKKMYNKEWRNLLLAFLSALRDNDNNEIVIPVAENENIVLSTIPILFKAKFGYIEPNDIARLVSIDTYFEEEEHYEEEI